MILERCSRQSLPFGVVSGFTAKTAGRKILRSIFFFFVFKIENPAGLLNFHFRNVVGDTPPHPNRIIWNGGTPTQIWFPSVWPPLIHKRSSFDNDIYMIILNIFFVL